MTIEFSFTSEQELFRKEVRYFLQSEIEPTVEQLDKQERFPEENVRKLAARGYFGIPIPGEYGGLGLGEIEYGIFLEEIGRICPAHGTIVGAHTGLCSIPIWLFGRDSQKIEYLALLAKGERLGAFALTEPQAGSDAANLRLMATRNKDEYVLNGTKVFTTNGNSADIIVTFALTAPQLGAKGGITAFIIEKEFPGFNVGRIEKKMGIRASTTVELIFKDCRVPLENILGTEGKGYSIALTALDGGRASLSAGALGGAEGALDRAVAFLTKFALRGDKLEERQSLLTSLADIAIETYAARFVAYNSLAEMDRYFRMLSRTEAVPREQRDNVSRNSAIAKTFVSEVSRRAAERCFEICGTLGAIEGVGVERALRDSFVSEIYEGTNEIQRLIIAEDILRKGGL